MGPFAIEDGNFVYKGDDGGVWSVCGDGSGYQLYLSREPISISGCIGGITLTVPNL
jgi:hypothetical protein